MTASASPRWTSSQLAGIRTTGHSLLLSAAAGSGKTAVLAERCAHLVCDAAGACDIDQLLVVTFTESAAAEMKTRIQSALRRRLESNYSDRLARQVNLAEHAHVSTVHGFCFRLLKQNFTLAGIDPDFEVLDAEEAGLLRREIATDLFHQRYELDETGAFGRLVDAYGDGDDAGLNRRVISTHNLLSSLIDPQAWIEKSTRQMRQAAEVALEESELGRELLAKIKAGLESLVRRCQDAGRTVAALGREFAPYVEYLRGLSPFFAHWMEVLEKSGLDMLVSEVADYRSARPRVPAIRNKPAGKELAKSIVDGIKEAVDLFPLKELLSGTAGDWRDGMRRVAPHADTFLSLVHDFREEYSAAKSTQRVLDFTDLERLSLHILRDGAGPDLRPSPLARSLHEQFRHVLVDEYQDINPIQDAILKLVSQECRDEAGANLFCVGDVKQSIFRFRLAEPRRFLQRYETFSAAPDKRLGEVIALRENFRSREPLLEAINGVFERLMTREAAEIEYDQSHRLAAGRKFPPAANRPSFTGAPMELHLIPKDPGEAEGLEPMPESEKLERVDYEAILLARRINQMMGNDGSPKMNVADSDKDGHPILRPIEFSDIVILLRAMKNKADQIADILRAAGIPVHNEAGGGLFEATEVRDMLALLRILDNQQQDIPLAAVLRSPLAGLPDADDSLARVRVAFPEIPFHQAVPRYAAEKDDELSAYLRDFLSAIARWRDLANKRPVAELLWQLYEETAYLAFAGGLEDGDQRTANLLHLHERAGQFGQFRRQGLYRFLRFLESLEEDADLRRPSPVGQSEKVVRIMSIHRSKGLEFPVVLLPDLGKAMNISDISGSILVDRESGLGMAVVDEERLIRYPSLASTLVSQNLFRQTKAEELRLLYVAMTRAKEHLVLVATNGADELQEWTAQWSGHSGALPADDIVSATRVIDWLGPVAAMTASSAMPIFEIHSHPAEDVRLWKHPRHHRPAFSARQKQLARLEPLPVNPPVTEAARELMHRLQTVYSFEPFTKAPATASVTSIAKGGIQSRQTAAPLERKLDLPRFFQAAAPKATDIGTATHTLLQYFDFAVGESEIENQIDRLVAEKLLSPEHAKLVDRPAVKWLLQSEIGQLIREHHGKLLREVPFALMRSAGDCPASSDPLDQIMIRGRIDLLIPTPAGLAIVDYKTDKVGGAELDQRAEAYRRQMNLYAEALENVAQQKIAGIYLVFLTPRRIVRS